MACRKIVSFATGCGSVVVRGPNSDANLACSLWLGRGPARTGTHGSEAALDTKSRDSQLTPVVALAILFQHLLRIVPGQPAQLILDEGEVEDMPRLCVLRLLRAVGTPAKHADAL